MSKGENYDCTLSYQLLPFDLHSPYRCVSNSVYRQDQNEVYI